MHNFKMTVFWNTVPHTLVPSLFTLLTYLLLYYFVIPYFPCILPFHFLTLFFCILILHIVFVSLHPLFCLITH